MRSDRRVAIFGGLFRDAFVLTSVCFCLPSLADATGGLDADEFVEFVWEAGFSGVVGSLAR